MKAWICRCSALTFHVVVVLFSVVCNDLLGVFAHGFIQCIDVFHVDNSFQNDQAILMKRFQDLLQRLGTIRTVLVLFLCNEEGLRLVSRCLCHSRLSKEAVQVKG